MEVENVETSIAKEPIAYYALIERHPRDIKTGWSVIVFICMIIVILSGFFSIYGAQKLLRSFDFQCIYNTKKIVFELRNKDDLIFQTRKNTIITTSIRVPESATEITTNEQLKNDSFQLLEPNEENKKRNRSFSRIYRFFGHDQVISEADLEFISSMKVNVADTRWNDMDFCEYILYNPVLTVIAAIVCTTMLAIFNTTGKVHLDWGIPKAWRIVFPGVMAFGIMSLVQYIHIAIINNAQHNFCNALSANITTKSLRCFKLIDALHTPPTAKHNLYLTTGETFLVHTVSIRITLLGWFGAFLVMLFRMLLAIDFQLIQVNIAPLPIGRSFDRSKSTLFKTTQKSVHFKLPVSKSNVSLNRTDQREDVTSREQIVTEREMKEFIYEIVPF